MISEKNETWEIQFKIATNFVCCKNKDGECIQKVVIKKLRLMLLKAVKVIKKLFK